MKRLFVSIPLPPEWLDAFGKYCVHYSVRGIQWTLKENIHITACFLGDVKEEHMSEIKEKIAKVCARTAPFSLAFDRMVFGPPGREPRMVWAMFQKSDAYEQLVKEMQETLREFLAVEPHKELIPHATLARFRDPQIAREIDIARSQPALTSFEISTVELMESRLDPAGVQYETIEIFSFTVQK